MLSERLPELLELEKVIEKFKGQVDVETLAHIEVEKHKLPLYGLVIGSKEPTAPTIGFFAGVHGLERIGTRVLNSYLTTLQSLSTWDESTQDFLKKARIVTVPIVNPSGMYLRQRSNRNGVDLMRNAPVESFDKMRWRIVGGHRISPKLPWYRGVEGAPMETESSAICNFVRKWIFPSSFSLALDIHSGFGTIDRLWFPYAKTKQAFPDIHVAYAFKDLLDKTYPNHVYRVEPQALQYTTHGDLWDYLYDEHRALSNGSIFIPWALELGSWVWVKKNPRQMFTILGVFNPLIQHRHQRICRRHLALLDFFQKSTVGYKRWAEVSPIQQNVYSQAAQSLWYKDSVSPTVPANSIA
jgi:hypothetical protein